MNDNVIDFRARRATAPDPFQGTALERLGRRTSTSLALLTARAQGMRQPVQLTALVDATWPASEVAEQLQILLLREPRNSATITRADGHVIGDSRYLFHTEQFLESHAVTIEEACAGGAVLEFDPITGWRFDLALQRAPHLREINDAGLVEMRQQVGAVPLDYSPAMADAVLALFGGEPATSVPPRVLAEVLHRDRIVHFPPPGDIDARGQLLVYWVLRALELNVEYMQVIDVVAETIPRARELAMALGKVRLGDASQVKDDELAFLKDNGFILPTQQGFELTGSARELAELHPFFEYYAVIGMYCKQLESEGVLRSFPVWNPSAEYGFAEFDLQAYAQEVSSLTGH
ncbi:hypothetical protein QVA66_08650 [Staphylococcus chromogenes]|nr:hypothetical protein [Staphylococcus chromogenes]